ncbi:Inositol 2-dehydrogenase/D-chiro-inositol 3-dehydrogenase [Planctomycetes bacterium CA13]|uniref:Inositol 2-dehydrogenase/D-chiro-inositol 3-dehydrogenase n=1 Tax=Novipirellula herctigrandis TaxID=2527986 RepID=A0A5C5ZD07_9BACT|nr:Inositol 2-dehydrogenase/D-chiro-inositol 3-dehydrogenase [Planctomycetes bacterium CA13]
MQESKCTRRTFMNRTTAISAGIAAGAATIVAPQRVRGSQANSRVRVACVGLGGRGSMIANMIHQHPGLEVAAVVDYFPEVAAAAAERFGLTKDRAFSGLKGYQRALDAGVDAMVLKTIPYFFPEQANAAVDAGCHVYMAKPVAVDVPGCLTIRKQAEKATNNEKVFHVDFQWRYLPPLVECMKHIREGKLDNIRFVRAFYNDEGRQDVAVKKCVSEIFQGLRWAMSRELGGDRIVSGGIHAVDTAMMILGAHPTQACGVAQRSRKNPINSGCDTFSLTYTFPEGAVMNYSGDQFRNYHHEIDTFAGVKVYADHSYLQTFYQDEVTQMRNADWRYEGEKFDGLYSWGARHNIDLFHKAIVEGDYANSTVPGAVDSNLACLLGAEAGRSRTIVTWKEMLANTDRVEIDPTGLVD